MKTAPWAQTKFPAPPRPGKGSRPPSPRALLTGERAGSMTLRNGAVIVFGNSNWYDQLLPGNLHKIRVIPQTLANAPRFAEFCSHAPNGTYAFPSAEDFARLRMMIIAVGVQQTHHAGVHG